MTTQFSHNVSVVLASSREEALRLSSPSVEPEHLVLGMLKDEDNLLHVLFERLKIDESSVKRALESQVKTGDTDATQVDSEIVLDQQASNILRLAVLEARVLHAEIVEVQHLILAILHDHSDNGAKEILEKNKMEYVDVLTFIKAENEKDKVPADSLDVPNEAEEELADDKGGSSQVQTTKVLQNNREASKTPFIDHFTTDLTRAAADGKLDAVVGRESEIHRVIEILCRRKKNNPVLIGEPGVGKSAIVEGLAQRIVKHETTPFLFNKRVVSLDLTSVVAGTKYRGQFEERIQSLVNELEQNPDVIVFVDEIHTIIGAGNSSGSMDAANILKPALARGTLQFIGATTLKEYRNSIEKDGALERRFQKVMVEPTTSEETLAILHNIKGHYEQHHHVRYDEMALTACVKLTQRYITDRFFPDKAIDALDEVGARVHLQHAKIPTEITDKQRELADVIDKKRKAVQSQDFELAARCRDQQTTLEGELEMLNRKWADEDGENWHGVSEHDVEDVVSMMAGIPVQRISEDEYVRLRQMPEQLKQYVIAQDAAIEKIAKAIQRNRVGIKDPNHPIGAFMFLGPTGVGKTYLAKQLAHYMFGSDDTLIRIDMSEYAESFNASRLIGAPPGYVGYEEGGQLTERVRRHPYSIVLLDEIEKAHTSIYNLLLQMLDEGRLTDGNGRKVDFRNTVIIMTSNTGTRQLKDFGQGIGFTANRLNGVNMTASDKEYARSIIQKSLSKQFAPEFLNRLDEIITFDQLDLEAIKKIIDIELRGLLQRMQELGHPLHITEAAKDFVATKGYDVQFGARPLKRAIQTYIEDVVSEQILSGNLDDGDAITIHKNPDKDALTAEIQKESSSGI
ncbi:ATP-dependent Clp protease ATP-binding subunit [Segatella oulorum]|uniref:ATP-dependent Clp protease ATP-binding subunit n=1 Tax=Segatella oulorum TaxID=28136 RepID=UPI0023F3A05A|nr:ATP-dependent Clp protease ATP-binding subunit [Segatella oulorum]